MHILQLIKCGRPHAWTSIQLCSRSYRRRESKVTCINDVRRCSVASSLPSSLISVALS